MRDTYAQITQLGFEPSPGAGAAASWRPTAECTVSTQFGTGQVTVGGSRHVVGSYQQSEGFQLSASGAPTWRDLPNWLQLVFGAPVENELPIFKMRNYQFGPETQTVSIFHGDDSTSLESTHGVLTDFTLSVNAGGETNLEATIAASDFAVGSGGILPISPEGGPVVGALQTQLYLDPNGAGIALPGVVSVQWSWAGIRSGKRTLTAGKRGHTDTVEQRVDAQVQIVLDSAGFTYELMDRLREGAVVTISGVIGDTTGAHSLAIVTPLFISNVDGPSDEEGVYTTTITGLITADAANDMPNGAALNLRSPLTEV